MGVDLGNWAQEDISAAPDAILTETPNHGGLKEFRRIATRYGP